MKTKKFTKVSARILVALLVFTMVITAVSTTLFTTVSAEDGVFWQNDSIKTDYEKYLDGSVVQKLPDTVKDDEEISVIINMNIPTLLDAYDCKDRVMSFGTFTKTEEAAGLRAEIAAEKEKYVKALSDAGIPFSTGADYANVLAGFEVIFEARYFESATKLLGNGAIPIVSEVYNVSETQVVTNNVVVNEHTGIFDTEDFTINGTPYSGSGMVVAVLDTGLDYTHPAFSMDKFNSNNPRLTKEFVASVIDGTKAANKVQGLTADDVYISEKVPFAFDYADNDSDVYSLHNNHGTHVSGVIVGHDDEIRGAAPDAQLVSMKIFSDIQDSAKASWILAALDDCVALEVDVINMSLGTACGFSRETDKEQMTGVYDKIRERGISLVVAASNSFNSAYGSEKNGNLGLTSNPDTSTVGSPSTYDGAFSIASIDGTMTPYLLDEDGTVIYFVEASDESGEQMYFYDNLLGDSKEKLTLEYVLVPGVGNPSDYNGIDVRGKIALVRRGSNTFEEKAKAAEAAGARALIVYNNTSGDIRMNVGDVEDMAVCSISQDNGEKLAARKTGTLTLQSTQKAGPFMSDFSSWGPSPSLQIKPEITAHGGNILSAVTGHGYDRLSGTSMACPNMAGVIALMRQYVKETFNPENNVELNAIVNRLFMSTADIVNNKNGLPYAVRKQGAGLASLTDAALTQAYILTYDRLDGSVMDKTKIELGDDPAKTGVYTLKFSIDNFGTTALSYDISAIVMTEGVSNTPTYQGETVVSEEGYLLEGASVVISSVTGGAQNGSTVTVNGGTKCDVTVTITLSDEDKAYLDSSFENGMYVEGFIKLTAKDAGSTDLNVPYLTFYGNWYQAPLFDLDYFETNADELNDAIATLDKTLPDAYATRPIGGISEDYVSYLGSYYFVQNPANKIIAASRDYIALSNTEGTIHSLRFVWGGLLRNADKIVITITDDATGEVILERTEESVRKSYGDGGSYIYPANIEIEFDAATENLKNNSTYTVKLQGYLDYNDGTGVNKTPEYNLNSTFEFPLTIDFQAPAITGCDFYTEYDKDAKKTRLFLEMAVYDNHYAMGMQLGYIGYQLNADGTIATDESTGEPINMLYPFDTYMTPIYSVRNGITYVTYEITDHIFDVKHGSTRPNSIAVSVYDYALNEATYEIRLPDEFAELYLENTEIYLNPNEVYTITANVYPEKSWDELLSYTSSNTNVVRVVNNKLIAIKPGQSIINIFDSESGKAVEMLVTVRDKYLYEIKGGNISYTLDEKGNKIKDPDYKEISKPVADVFELTGYETLKAFYFMSNDERDIGQTGDVVLFSNQNYKLAFYPSESVKISYKLDAYFPNDTTVEFISNNENVVSVTQDGTIVAINEGYTSITVRVVQDGKATYTTKTISIEVKDPYARTGPTLNNYYGAGELNSGKVVITADMNFTQIGQYAFSNFDYIPKEAEDYDPDDDDTSTTKMTYIGNDFIKEIVFEDDVEIETIGAFAFAGLTALEKVTLPPSLEAIEYGAFYGCTSLKEVKGLENVKLINQNAFAYCNISNDLSLDSIHAIGDYAFAGNSNLKSVKLPSTLSSIGAYAFMGNTKLTNFDVSDCGKVKYGPYVFMNCFSIETLTLDTAVIPTGAFYNCRNLENVLIGKNVSYIGEYAFTGTEVSSFNLSSENTVYKTAGANNNALLSKDGSTLILVAPETEGEFALEGVTKVGYGAFAGNKNITSVNMPDVTYVDGYAFAECENLTEINLGALTDIGKYSFFLTAITEHPPLSGVDYIGDYAFAFSKITQVNIGNGKVIGEGAFCEMTELTTVTIGNDVVIGQSAFLRGSTTMDPKNPSQYLNIGSSAIDMGNGMYRLEYLSKLTSLTIGDNAMIGDSAFCGAAKLMSVSLGEGAKIGRMAFYNCRALKNIDLSKVISIGEMAFSGDNSYAYSNKDGSSYAIKNGNYVLVYYNPILTDINLSSLEELGDQAFIYCQSLKSVTLGDKLTTIPKMAFANCPALTTVNLENVVILGYGAFAETNITSANLDLSKVEVVGEYAFTYCKNLTGITLNPNGADVEEGAFSYCSTLVNVANLNKASTIGNYAFAYTAMVEADLESAVSVGDHAFMKESLTDFTVKLGENLVSLGDNPFAMCRLNPHYKTVTTEWNGKPVKVENVYTYDINDYVKIIDGSIYCKVPSGLELITYIGLDETGKSLDKSNVVVDEDTVRITAMAFAGSDITRVELPHKLNSIGHKAFFGCEKLMLVVFKSYSAPVLEEEFDQNYYDSYDNIPATGSYEFNMVVENGEGKLEYQPLEKNGLGIVPYYMWNISDSKYSNIYYGANFVDNIGHYDSANMGNLIMVAPSNGVYYDSFIYSQYFGSTIDGAVAMDDVTVAALEAINKIPTTITLADEHLVIAARAAYSKISSAEQQALITDEYKKLVDAETLINALKGTEAPEEETPTAPEEKKDIGKIILIISVAVEALALITLVSINYLWPAWKKHRALTRVKKAKAKLETVMNAKEAESEEITESEIMSYERFTDDPKEAKRRLIKRIAVYSLLSIALVVSVILLATKCSKDTSPYPGYEEEGYTVSVKFDANGGVFTTNTESIIDTYSLSQLPDGSEGKKSIMLIDPNDSSRGGQAYLAAKVGYYLAGWYVNRTEVTDDAGNVIGYTYSNKWDFAKHRYEIPADGNYSSENPVLTLYAAWVPAFTYEFYAVDKDGNATLFGTKNVDPTANTPIIVPAFNEVTGGVDANDFPTLKEQTYIIDGDIRAIYYDAECKDRITDTSITHVGTYNSTNATVENATMKIYCKLQDGVHFKISSTEQLVQNAVLNGVYTLESDLDFTDYNWPAIFTTGSFKGQIIGNGYSIENVTVEQTDNSATYFGLFGQLADGALLENVTFNNITVNITEGCLKGEPKFGIIAGSVADGVFNGVSLENSELVICNKKNSSTTILKPEYGIVCGYGSVSGIDFSVGNGVSFSTFGAPDSTETVEYLYQIDENGRFTLTEKTS